jgi:hypothetical protein
MKNTSQNLKITIKALAEQFNVTVTVSKYAPGDGWTRYGVSVNGWQDMKQGMTASECEGYLSGMYDLLRVQQHEKSNHDSVVASFPSHREIARAIDAAQQK